MHNQPVRNKVKVYIIALLLIAAFFSAVVFCSNRIEREMSTQLEHTLKDVANQNAVAIRNQIHNNHLLLDSLVVELKNLPGDMSENVVLLSGFVKKYGLKRIGYCAPDGMTHTSDNKLVDLSYREFFQRGMEGKSTITGVLSDALSDGHENVSIMTSPMYDDNTNELIGVFGLIYSSDTFNSTLQVDCFDGEGCSFVIGEDGEIMVAMGNDSLQLSQNLFDDILLPEGNNDEAITDIRNYIANSSSGFGTLYLNGEAHYYCTPVSLMNGEITWYVFTLVPSAYMNVRTRPIIDTLYMMIFFVVLIVVIGLFITLINSLTHKKAIMRLAFSDPLTKGDNYAGFCRRLTRMRNRIGYLVYMDILSFNNVIIAAGYQTGDEMLIKTWDTLLAAINDNEKAGRVGEDIFVLFLTSNDTDNLVYRLQDISDRIHNLAIQYQVPGVHACFGIYPIDNTTSLDDAYTKAKMGSEFAKKSHRCCAFYNELDHEELLKNQQLEERFDDALKNHNFELWYQPKYSAKTHEIVGSEALVRWREDDGTLVSPGRFIPLFESNGYISRLDEYVFREACIRQKYRLDNGYKTYPVSINISRATLYSYDVVEKYTTILNEYDLNPKYIQLEVLESAIAGKADIAKLLERFRSIGIRILMDDFGTGYSSLATLNMRCFDTLKLDKSLIDCIGDKNGETLLHYVIRMGRKLGLHITAEGVEYEEQLKYLQEQECDDIQGFYFSRPLPVEEYEKLIA